MVRGAADRARGAARPLIQVRAARTKRGRRGRRYRRGLRCRWQRRGQRRRRQRRGLWCGAGRAHRVGSLDFVNNPAVVFLELAVERGELSGNIVAELVVSHIEPVCEADHVGEFRWDTR